MIKIARFVICKACGKKFDREVTPAVKVTANRYAHLDCVKGGYTVPQEELDMIELHKYLKELFKEEYNYYTLQKQIEAYQRDHEYSITGILKTLKYWYEVKHNKIDKAHGRIGIVPHVYKQAYDYYYNIHIINTRNQMKKIQEPSLREIKIKPPQPSETIPPQKLFNLDD